MINTKTVWYFVFIIVSSRWYRSKWKKYSVINKKKNNIIKKQDISQHKIKELYMKKVAISEKITYIESIWMRKMKLK